MHVYKGYTSTYNVEILNYSNPELQHKYTEFVIKNKLIDLLLNWKTLNLWQH